MKRKRRITEQPPARSGPQSYRLRVTLEGIKPPIWRTVVVDPADSLHRLHEILQIVMGWENCHLYLFTDGSGYYGEPCDGAGDNVKASRRVRIADALRSARDRIRYRYDMGDRWEHIVKVETILAASDAPDALPVCEAGRRACPPEDCGGIYGYEQVVNTLAETAGEDAGGSPHRFGADRDALLEWVGEFDPERFSVAAVNRVLRRLVRPRRKTRKAVREQVANEVAALLSVVDALAGDEPMVTPDVRFRARQLLESYAQARPGEMQRAHKHATWAAGSLHAAFMTLIGPGLSASALGQMFGVSLGSVNQRSLELCRNVERSGKPLKRDIALEIANYADRWSIRQAQRWARGVRQSVEERKAAVKDGVDVTPAAAAPSSAASTTRSENLKSATHEHQLRLI